MENIEEPIQPFEPKKSLEIIPSQKLLMGVCGAFGNYLKINPVIIRIIVLLAFLFIGQPIVLIYSAFGILLPINETAPSTNENLSNRLTLNILFFLGIILLLLVQLNQVTLKDIFNFVNDKVDSFSLLVFSIALIINGYHKQGFEMKEGNYKRLTLSDKKFIFGVCAGLAEYLNINPNLMRILWIIFGISSFGTAILIYIILRFVIPSKNKYADYDIE